MRQGTPHTPRVFEVTSLNHSKVQRQGAHVSPEAASVTTKDRHRRPPTLALALEMLRPGSSSLLCSSPCDLFAPPYPINPFLFYVFPSFPKLLPPTIPLHSQPTILCSAEESSHQTASSHIHLKVPASSPQPTVHLTWADPFTFLPGAVEDCLLPPATSPLVHQSSP